MKNKFLYPAIIIILASFFCISNCITNSDKYDGNNSVAMDNKPKPLNLSIFVDLSDRILKEKDGMKQAEKDQMIINGIATSFIDKQKNFQKSEDCFQIVFYPAPEGTHALADSLSLNLKEAQGIQKKKSLLSFQDNHSENLKHLYNAALNTDKYFGSDIWGYFKKDKVKDLCKDGYRNVLVILSDGYIFDSNNQIKDGNNYSYILPRTLAIKKCGLIPCKISNTDLEIYFMECNANPQTDFTRMKEVLNNWFTEMGIEKIDIQDTDIPANTLNHLKINIFDN